MTKNLAQRVGHRIKVRRTELEMSQSDLAKVIGVSQGHMSNLEKGIRAMDLETLGAIAKALRCKPEQLVREPMEAA